MKVFSDASMADLPLTISVSKALKLSPHLA
jgi:hypothetical protein